MSAALLTLTGFTSTPNDGATAWMAANWAVPDDMAGSRSTEARVRPGAICLRISSHFPLIPYSILVNPVALPPGRARLSTKPPPTGSATCTKTIGTARVACSNGAKVEVPGARRTSGRNASNSAANLRALSALAAPQRKSIVTLRPTVQPNCCRPCKKAALRAWACGSSAGRLTSTPIRRIRSGCCARAATGHTAAPLSSVMKSRRFKPKPPVLPTERIAYLCEGRRLLRCGISIGETVSGRLYVPTGNLFKREQVQPSQDHHCHVCLGRGSDHDSICAFIVPNV